jgi:hypothetical protein
MCGPAGKHQQWDVARNAAYRTLQMSQNALCLLQEEMVVCHGFSIKKASWHEYANIILQYIHRNYDVDADMQNIMVFWDMMAHNLAH